MHTYMHYNNKYMEYACKPTYTRCLTSTVVFGKISSCIPSVLLFMSEIAVRMEASDLVPVFDTSPVSRIKPNRAPTRTSLGLSIALHIPVTKNMVIYFSTKVAVHNK